MPHYTKYLLGIGLILVFVFSNVQETLLGTIKATLANILPTLLGFISAFADTVSYIRLFAVGMTGIAVSGNFYEIANQVGFNNVITGFISALIIVFAHSLNIVLGLMSVLVHGLRLNILEFCGHAGLTWSGYKYSPFKKLNEIKTKE